MQRKRAETAGEKAADFFIREHPVSGVRKANSWTPGLWCIQLPVRRDCPMATKRCKIHYRRLRRDAGQFPGLSLSDAIAQALATRSGTSTIGASPASRVVAVPAAPEYRRLLLHSHVEAGNTFGTLCLFAPGQQQAFLQLAEAAEHGGLEDALRAWEIKERAAPQGHEYLHGLSYFLAIDDHFYQVQHVALQAKAAEEYFTWLLRDQTQTIGAPHYVELRSLFDRDQVGEDLTSIEIGGLMPETITPEPEFRQAVEPAAVDVIERESLGERAAATFDKGRRILEELLGTVETDRIIESMPDEASLEVKVNIGYRARKTKLRKEVMRNLEAGLRNIPDGEIRAKGPGGVIKGDDARLSIDLGVRLLSETSSLLDLEHARERMLEAHRRFLDDDKL